MLLVRIDVARHGSKLRISGDHVIIPDGCASSLALKIYEMDIKYITVRIPSNALSKITQWLGYKGVRVKNPLHPKPKWFKPDREHSILIDLDALMAQAADDMMAVLAEWYEQPFVELQQMLEEDQSYLLSEFRPCWIELFGHRAINDNIKLIDALDDLFIKACYDCLRNGAQ